MIKYILTFLFFSSLSFGNFKSCPKSKTLAPLSHMHKVKSVVLAHPKYENDKPFFKQITEIIAKYERDVSLTLVSRSRNPYIQDQFELVYDSNSKEYVVLIPDHANGGVGFEVAGQLGLRKEIYGFDTYSPEASGNIESIPGGINVLGSSLKESHNFPFDRDKTLFLSENGTEAKHVDQIFTIIAKKKLKRNNLCPFTLFYSSPSLGIELVKKLNSSESVQIKGEIRNRMRFNHGVHKGCLDLFPHSTLGEGEVEARDLLSCPDYLKKVRDYNAYRMNQLAEITKKVQSTLNCELEKIPLPYLPDAYEPIAPNPVNALVLNNVVIIGKQANKLFTNVIRETIFKYTNMSVEFVDDSTYHFGSGNVHCVTNVIRTCN